ncbi:hypothetical protein ACJJTC_000679 [Scirpophaga incertulas]
MQQEHKQAWKCHFCRSKMPKKDNTNTPIRIHQQDTPETPSNSNVTIRRKQTHQHIFVDSEDEISIVGDTKNESFYQEREQQIQKQTRVMPNQNIHALENSRKVVLYGLNENYSESEYELHDYIIHIFIDLMNVNLTGYIEDVRRIGKRGNRRPIVIELLSKNMKKHLLSHGYMFKNTGFVITEFLDDESLRERHNLRRQLLEARRNNHHGVIKRNKLIIDGQIHEQNSNLPEKNTSNINSPKDNSSNIISQTLETQEYTRKDRTTSTHSHTLPHKSQQPRQEQFFRK